MIVTHKFIEDFAHQTFISVYKMLDTTLNHYLAIFLAARYIFTQFNNIKKYYLSRHNAKTDTFLIYLCNPKSDIM